MSTPFVIADAPRFITSTAADLATAIAGAEPGTIITVPEAGANLDLSLASISKAGQGVVVKLPLDQRIRVVCTGNTSNIHFRGGYVSGDQVLGNSINSNNGLTVNADCSKISWTGGYFDDNYNAALILGDDVLLRRNFFGVSRNDHIKSREMSRFAVLENEFGEGQVGEKFCYFDSSRPPEEGVSKTYCEQQGGIWADVVHSDHCQPIFNSDFYFGYNNCFGYGLPGVVSFNEFSSGDPEWDLITRAEVEWNNFRSTTSNAIYLRGTDIRVQNNTVALPETDADTAGKISVLRDTVDARIAGGRNSAPPGSIFNPAGIDLGAATIDNSEGVVAVERPRIVLPPWVGPTPARPAALPLQVPRYLVDGAVLWHGAPTAPGLGKWLAMMRGQWAGPEGAEWFFRWLLDGDVIEGAMAQNYQVQAGDLGAKTITGQCMGENATGPSTTWYTMGTAVTAAS